MKTELTVENIRKNMVREYGTKPQAVATVALFGGIVVAVCSFATGRLPAMVLGLIFIGIGLWDLRKSSKMRNKILSDNLVVKEVCCTEKTLKPGAGGAKRYFYFSEDQCYLASNQDVRLWEKTQVGDKFYMVSFEGSDEIEQIYPESALVYTNK